MSEEDLEDLERDLDFRGDFLICLGDCFFFFFFREDADEEEDEDVEDVEDVEEVDESELDFRSEICSLLTS